MAADDGAAMLREMKRLNTPMISAVNEHEINAMIAAPGPVRSWTVTTLRNEDGQEVDYDIPGPRTGTIYRGSTAAPEMQQTIALAVGLIDWPALIGKDATQIADYAVMRTLAKTRPMPAGGRVDTILALFDDPQAPKELSEADLAYLTALYSIPRPEYSRRQIGVIAAGVKKAGETTAKP